MRHHISMLKFIFVQQNVSVNLMPSAYLLWFKREKLNHSIGFQYLARLTLQNCSINRLKSALSNGICNESISCIYTLKSVV